MSARVQLLSAALLSAWLASGCALQAGPRVGVVADGGGHDARYAHAANVSAAVAKQTQGVGLHAGAEVEGYAEWERGGIWTTGLQLGPSYTPAPSLLAPGIVAHADVGFALTSGLYDGYVGGGFGIPLALEPRLVTDRNRGFVFVARRIELMPVLRYRAYWYDVGNEALWRHGVAGGLNLRLRIESDIVADLF